MKKQDWFKHLITALKEKRPGSEFIDKFERLAGNPSVNWIRARLLLLNEALAIAEPHDQRNLVAPVQALFARRMSLGDQVDDRIDWDNAKNAIRLGDKIVWTHPEELAKAVANTAGWAAYAGEEFFELYGWISESNAVARSVAWAAVTAGRATGGWQKELHDQAWDRMCRVCLDALTETVT